ncbi:hypothetical protein D3C79_784240 [compost metagenome]
MEHDVSAKLERLLQRRGAEAVVHHQHGTTGMGNFGQRGNVHQFGQRVGRRFDDQQLGIGLDGLVPTRQINQRHVVHLHAETLEVLLEQADRRTEHTLRHQHMVAGAAQRHHHGEDRRHAGRGGHGLLGTFHGRQALLEGTHGRVGVARVDVARRFAGKARGRIGGRAEHIAGGQEQRFAVLGLRCTVLTGAHRQGVETDTLEVTVQSPGIPLIRHAVALQISCCRGR